MCDFNCVQLGDTIHHWTVPIIFSLVLQSIVKADMTSIGGEEQKRTCVYTVRSGVPDSLDADSHVSGNGCQTISDCLSTNRFLKYRLFIKNSAAIDCHSNASVIWTDVKWRRRGSRPAASDYCSVWPAAQNKRELRDRSLRTRAELTSFGRTESNSFWTVSWWMYLSWRSGIKKYVSAILLL